MASKNTTMKSGARDLRVRADRRPLAYQVADALLTYITTEGLRGGDSLPSEPDLAQMFGVGRSTVREALMHLESDGIVNRRQGHGTVLTALATDFTVGLEVLEPMEERARRYGSSVAVRDIDVGEEPAPPPVASALRLAPGTTLLTVTRTLSDTNGPLAVIRSFVSPAVSDAAAAARVGNLADVLFSTSNAAYAIADLTPAVATGDIARRLELDDGALVLRIEQLIVGADDEPRAWSEQWIASDRLRVHVLRRPPRTRAAGSH